ncbi:MAG: membrane protein insertion efficiency factor YidD [Candidatus Acidiferrales bacterium]
MNPAPAAHNSPRSIAARCLLFAVGVYQSFFSPFFGAGCKFYPSCSHYAAQAVARHGARRGVWLAVKRLLRCRPFAQGGYDPVPEHLEENNSHAALDRQGAVR